MSLIHKKAASLIRKVMSNFVLKFDRHILPDFILSIKDSVNDTLNAILIIKAAHRSCTASYFSETTLNNVRSAKLNPKVFRFFEEV